ncbi:TRAP transporter substrate-binding protein [Oscillibacter sp.]|jgi:tripartite ATP-independent transporter DctP family solute receptor|uniref:TRAP transporter substrate-binding protein n=1 Tax=Oscillibacter sp. TaxID=1945593 RepID=UPI00216FF17C|nr:TRAP transporter substrate-binding protein [Oscillibacter sp.]MCI9239684.1 TRAP transporter substrate-binding protein [Oscillibacter sp.]
MKKSVLRKSLALVLTLLMMLSLASCGANSSGGSSSSQPSQPAQSGDASSDAGSASAKTPEYNLKMSGTVTEDHLVTQTERFFVEKVEELSEGRIHIDLYPANQLGDPRSMLEATSMGNNDIVECGNPIYANFSNQLKFFNLPFLFDNRDAAYAFMDTEQGQVIRKQIESDVGVHILGLIDNGFFTFTSNMDIKTPNDVKGYKIRCQESDVLLQIWTDLGASPLPMSFTEVYTALQQGAIDGQMNGYITNYNSGYYEVQKYTTSLGLLFDVCPLSINADLYYSMPEDLRAVLDEAGAQMQSYCIERAREENARCRDGCIENGMVINDLNDDASRAPWIEKAQATYEWFRSSFPEVDLDAILKTVDELNTQYAASTADEVL